MRPGHGSKVLIDSYWQQGFCRVGTLDGRLIDSVRRQLDVIGLRSSDGRDPASDVRAGSVFQLYDVPLRPPPLGSLPNHPVVRGATASLLGEDVAVAWGLLLNKGIEEELNWEIPWHQDTSVYCSVKPHGAEGEQRGGFLTFRPADDLMGRLVVARVAIDEETSRSGSLCVAPGSHCLGNRWPDGGRMFEDQAGIPVELRRGDVFLFNPLLMHRAERNEARGQRRVVHIYYRPISMALPNGAEWIDWSELRKQRAHT